MEVYRAGAKDRDTAARPARGTTGLFTRKCARNSDTSIGTPNRQYTRHPHEETPKNMFGLNWVINVYSIMSK
jgi:hypothetical protein